MTIIRVLEHDASNSLSVLAALRSLGLPCSHILPEELESISSNSWLVIPGVGHMKSLSTAVDSSFGIDKLKTLVIEKNLAVLGICLGFQFLCLSSAEDPHSETLGLLEFHVQSITTPPTPSVGLSTKRHISVDMLAIYPDLVPTPVSRILFHLFLRRGSCSFNESADSLSIVAVSGFLLPKSISPGSCWSNCSR